MQSQVFQKIADPAFLAHVREVSDYFDEALHDFAAAHPKVIELRGRGLMRGIQIDGSAAAAREAGHSVGLLMATAGDDILRLVPPLIFERERVFSVSAGEGFRGVDAAADLYFFDAIADGFHNASGV